MEAIIQDFSHPALNEQVTAIGGSYFILKEGRLPFADGEILYLVGAAIFDTTCCGTGGCAYAQVPGFIRKWRYKTDQNGRPVSGIQPVTDLRQQKKIREMIMRRESVLQVDFA